MFRRWRKLNYKIIKNYHHVQALFSKRPGVTKAKRNPAIVVSLTTFAGRLHKVYLCIESLLRQSCKPDYIMLWLSVPEDKIPKKLARLKKRGLQIKFCKDIGSYTKIIYALKENPESIIVTADDDHFYPKDWLKQLYDAYQKEPQYIHCHRAHLMTQKPDGKLQNYRKWNWKSQGVQGPSLLLFPTGVGGVLYPPHSFSEEVFNKNIFMRLAPYHDDAWLKAMSLLKGTECKKVSPFSPKYVHIKGVKQRCLSKINAENWGEKGDAQIRAVFDYYNLNDFIGDEENRSPEASKEFYLSRKQPAQQSSSAC